MIAVLGANRNEISTVIGIIPRLQTCGRNAVLVSKFISQGIDCYAIIQNNNFFYLKNLFIHRHSIIITINDIRNNL